jgi:aspartate aminotransferase
MQHVAAYVLSEPPEVREHVAAGRRLHRTVSLAAWERLVGARVECRRPGGGFYLYPDFEPLRGRLGIETADGLAELLLERFGIAVLAGPAFGDDPGALRFRMATSLLYGRTDEQRWEALASDDPVSLPWIATALDRLDAAVAAIARS